MCKQNKRNYYLYNRDKIKKKTKIRANDNKIEKAKYNKTYREKIQKLYLKTEKRY